MTCTWTGEFQRASGQAIYVGKYPQGRSHMVSQRRRKLNTEST